VQVTVLAFYLGCLAFGGLFLAATIVGGHGDGADHGGADHQIHDAHGPSQWLPLLSIRFWTFFVAFFGLTGSALTALGGLAAALVPALAAGAGLGAGVVASRFLGGLAGRPLGLVASSAAHVGREGVLLLPVSRGQRGKIRLTIGGASTDLVAETEGGETLAAGTEAMVVEMRGAVAVVEPSPAALPPVRQDDKERT
jgi:membrane protein implicated in regulation of membrane protease activity